MTYRERLDDMDELKPTTLLDQINLYSAHKQSFLGKLPHYKYTVNYINRRYLSVPSGIATATAIIVTCESFYFTAAKLKYLPPPYLLTTLLLWLEFHYRMLGFLEKVLTDFALHGLPW